MSCGIDESDRAEDFSKESDEDYGPVADGVIGSDGIADAVNTNDHADALPEAEVVGDGHASPFKRESWEKDGESSPCEVIESTEHQDSKHPARGVIRTHEKSPSGVVEAGAEVEVVVEGFGFDEAEGEGVLHEIDAESTDGGGGCAAADQFGGDEEMSFVDEAGIEEGAEGL